MTKTNGYYNKKLQWLSLNVFSANFKSGDFIIIIITLFKVGVQTQLITNKNQLTKITKCPYNVKRKVIHKVTYPESISNMLLILDILTDHIATSQRSERTQSRTRLTRNFIKVCYLLHIIHPQSIIAIFLIIFLNSDTGLLDITKLGNLF